MTAQAPVVQGAVSEALSEQDIAFGADLWRRRSVSEAAIPLVEASILGAFSSQFRLETHQRPALSVFAERRAICGPAPGKLTPYFRLRAPLGKVNYENL